MRVGVHQSIKSRTIAWFQAENNRGKIDIAVGIGTGLFIGAIMLVARKLPSNWAGIIILATVTPTIVVLVRNMKALLLVVFIVDIPLGLDVSIFNQTDFSGGPAGLIVSLMTIALLVGYFMWLVKKPNSRTFQFSSHMDITLSTSAYFFFIILSTLSAIQVKFSLFSIFLHLQFFLMYLYLIHHIENWADVRLIFTVVIISVLIESLLMVSQSYIGFGFSAFGISTDAWSSDIASADVRAAGTMGPPNTVATFLATFLAIAFASILAGKGLVNRKLSLVAMLFGLTALISTQSRMAWIAFAVGILIITFGALLKRIESKAIWLLLIVAMIMGFGFSGQIIDRFTTSGQISAMSRLWYSELALNVIRDRPFTGVGANNQRFIMDDYDYVPDELIGRERTLIHNKYLSTWVELGLFGFLSFLGVLIVASRRILRVLIKTNDPKASLALMALLAGLVAYSMHMLVATFSGRIRLQMLWLILALIVAVTRIVEQSELRNLPVHRARKSQRSQ